MMDRTYQLNNVVHSHYSNQVSRAQQAQRIRLQRLAQQRNRMESLSDVISSSHRTIINLQKKVEALSDQNKKWELLYLQLQRQNEQLREQNKIVSRQLKREQSEKSKFIAWNTDLKQHLQRVQSQNNFQRLGKQFRNIDINQGISIQDSFIQKYSKLERKLAKKEKQNAVLKSELQDYNRSFQIKKNRNHFLANHNSHQNINLQKFHKFNYDQVKSQLRKGNVLKDRQKLEQSYSKKSNRQYSEKQLKVCPCHYIGKSQKSKRKVNDSLY